MFVNKMSVFLYQLAISYMVPLNMNIFWNFGVLGFFFLISQILTGMFLGMHYVPNLDLAFKSVEHIMSDVNFGWFMSYLHSNGASMFFFVMYMHVFSGLFYNSYMYPSAIVWMMGIIMLLLMMLTAFLGYVLPWGQMSFWAATVMTNLASAMPVMGNDVVIWLWGGFSVGNPTLNSFFSLHYMLPMVMLFLVVLHILFLHFTLSSNPLGMMSDIDTTKFGTYFMMKDIYGIYLMLFICSFFLFFYPNVLSHSDNYMPANALVTPNHMVPEWYFLPFYAILSSVPNKLFGVILLLASMLLLVMLPFMMSYEMKNTNLKPMLSFIFFYFVFMCIILGWMGSKDIMEPFYEIGQISTIFYFFYFLIILPLIHKEI